MSDSRNASSGDFCDFENNFDFFALKAWWAENVNLCWYASIIYVICIFGIQRYMTHRKRFEIRAPLAAWSAVLAIFSIFGAYRFIPNLYNVIATEGIVFSFCDRGFVREVPTNLWCALFVLSKVYELGDTLFIVLRKQPLIFLHWYHHITVLLYVWLNYGDEPGVGRWFVGMNYLVHAVMYTYYTLRALRINVPKSVNISITILQLTQMVIGLIINIWAYNIKESGGKCDNEYSNVKWAILMYLSYFILFANYFYNTYMKPKTGKQHLEKSQQNGVASANKGDNNNENLNGSVIKHRKIVTANGYK